MLQLLSRCEGMLLNRRVVERIAEALPACGVALSIGLGALGLAKGSVRAVCIVTLAVYVAIGITVSRARHAKASTTGSPAAPTSSSASAPARAPGGRVISRSANYFR